MLKRSALILFLGMLAAAASAQGVSSLVLTEFMASNSKTLADGTGEYSDWIEIYNPTASSVSLSGCYMSDDSEKLTKWPFPSTAVVPASGYLVVFASGNATGSTPYIDSKGYIHTSYKLSADGEDLLLVNTDGATIISSYVAFALQGADVSYGLGSNSIIGFLRSPTPGAANGAATTNGWVADTQFDIKRGFYSLPFTVTITCATAGATIKYTLDCSSPSSTNGTVYTAPIPISKTTVLRATAFKTDWISPDIDTQTYIFPADIITQPATKPNSLWPAPTTGGMNTQAMDYAMDTKVTNDTRYKDYIDDALLSIPTISVVSDPPNLFNTSTGIYANPDKDLECPAAVELILPNGDEGFHVNAGLKIRGGSTSVKSNVKHSFRVICRSDYGDTKIDYPMFGDAGAKKFDKIDLRTAQNFAWHNQSPQNATWLDDPFSHDTQRDMGVMQTRGFFLPPLSGWRVLGDFIKRKSAPRLTTPNPILAARRRTTTPSRPTKTPARCMSPMEP